MPLCRRLSFELTLFTGSALRLPEAEHLYPTAGCDPDMGPPQTPENMAHPAAGFRAFRSLRRRLDESFFIRSAEIGKKRKVRADIPRPAHFGIQSILQFGTAFLERTADAIFTAGTQALLLQRIALDEPSNMCNHRSGGLHMATNLSLEPELLEKALRVSGEKTKKAAVTKALKEFISRREQRKILELFGALEWDDTYDYKEHRSR